MTHDWILVVVNEFMTSFLRVDGFTPPQVTIADVTILDNRCPNSNLPFPEKLIEKVVTLLLQ